VREKVNPEKRRQAVVLLLFGDMCCVRYGVLVVSALLACISGIDRPRDDVWWAVHGAGCVGVAKAMMVCRLQMRDSVCGSGSCHRQ
jgi:hypothetical protein